MKVKGVLFDLDSTLAESRPAMDRALVVTAKRMVEVAGRPGDVDLAVSRLREIDREMHARRVYDRREWLRRLAGELWPDVRLSERLLEEMTEGYWRIVADGQRLFPDALEALESLRRMGFRLGMVTDTDGTPRVKRWRLERLGILGMFEAVVVGGEDTPGVKPDPEPFLLAASELGLKPSACLMVGDRVETDVVGAKAAGMAAVLVRRRDEDPDGADLVVESLAELVEILSQSADGVVAPRPH
jgi:putative hydrolase of the HAD superfamily